MQPITSYVINSVVLPILEQGNKAWRVKPSALRRLSEPIANLYVIRCDLTCFDCNPGIATVFSIPNPGKAGAQIPGFSGLKNILRNNIEKCHFAIQNNKIAAVPLQPSTN